MTSREEHLLVSFARDGGEIRWTRVRLESGATVTTGARWYRDRDGALRPTKCVVSIRDHELDDVLDMLTRIRATIRARGGVTSRGHGARGARREMPVRPPEPGLGTPADADPEGLF